MCARQVSSGVPYELLGKRIVFTNWNFVHQGFARWVNTNGDTVSVVGEEGPLDARLEPVTCLPSGICLKTLPAVPEMLDLELDQPWEQGGAIGTLMHDGDRYRAWVATGWGDLQIHAPGRRPNRFVLHMESEDGRNWTKPACGQVAHEGSTDNNIVFDTNCFIGGGVTFFKDPSAPPEERYKLVAECYGWKQDDLEAYRRQWPDDVDARAIREDVGSIMGVLGAVSPDGIQWTKIGHPLVISHCDTQLVCAFNAHTGGYVLYTRDYADLPRAEGVRPYAAMEMVKAARRSVGITQSTDFRHFPLPRLALQADLGMRPSEVLYTNCYTTVPGAPDHHLMFPAVWDLCHHDETWIALATSHDGLLWQYAPGGPVLQTGRFGQWDGGCVYTHPNLVELPDGDWVLPYTGFNVPHKYPRVNARRASGYAVWPRGRMMALASETGGRFETIAIVPPGARLFVNAVTRRAGAIRVAAFDGVGNPIPGRGMEDAVPLFGDLFWEPVRWNGHDTLGIGPGEDVILRIEMNEAEIYGFEFRD